MYRLHFQIITVIIDYIVNVFERKNTSIFVNYNKVPIQKL